jgi:23S rRNA pseudouridine1911/1915/1917 synthase
MPNLTMLLDPSVFMLFEVDTRCVEWPVSRKSGFVEMNQTSDGIVNDNLSGEASGHPAWLLLEDGPLIAVNKPAGILTEGIPAGEQTMVGLVKAWLAEKYAKPGNVYLGIPHRLDRATSGTMVFTRNSKTAARVAEQFEKRQVSKTYWAILENRPESDSGLLVDWLLKVPDRAISEVVASETPKGKEARLEYRILREVERGWLVEVNLLTGRMHQIRVQFSSRGCAVVGDTKYGAAAWLDDAAAVEPANEIEPAAMAGADDVSGDRLTIAASDIRIALHARSLSLQHPIRYDRLTLETPVPAYWNLTGD